MYVQFSAFVPAVFKAHVLEKLYPSEALGEETPSPQETTTKTKDEKSSKAIPAGRVVAKLYTVPLPPGGILQSTTQAAPENSGERSKSSHSESDSTSDSEGTMHYILGSTLSHSNVGKYSGTSVKL